MWQQIDSVLSITPASTATESFAGYFVLESNTYRSSSLAIFTTVVLIKISFVIGLFLFLGNSVV